LGQAIENNFANVTSVGSGVRFDVAGANGGMTLTVNAPDGRTFSKDYRGASAEFTVTDKSLPDGVYTYELRLQPALTRDQRDSLKAARKDDEPESDRAARKRPVTPNMVQSGSFALVNGQIYVAGMSEETRPAKASVQPSSAQPGNASRVLSGNTVTRLRNHRISLLSSFMPDQVIADDLIVQGSACVGLDCVNNESFGFDTIRMKENNTRISFVDTSTGTGFPTNDWTIRANSNLSGGASFLAFVDRGANSPGDESGTIVFEVDAGAPANALKVDSIGRVGLRTATPVLDLHVNTGNTPAMRYEQNSSGGFTAQTWDVGANEANFFVRDVTGGSRLPFRVRPGAPTSSIDIGSTGNVGVGTASPGDKLSIEGSVSGGIVGGYVKNTAGAVANTLTRFSIGQTNSESAGLLLQFSHGDDAAVILNRKASTGTLDLDTSGGGIRITNSGSVGIATTAPSDTLSVNGTASKPGGGSWSVFSDERLKTIQGNFNTGLTAVLRLQPLSYRYKPDNLLGLDSGRDYIGFGAQAVQQVIPEAVTKSANGYLQINNDPILWTMLNAIKEQQKEIIELRGQIRRLRATSRRRRR
jgi:hypothetical protein